MTIKTITELHEAIKNGAYEVEFVPTKRFHEGTVIDEDKSVKWNREEVARLNEDNKLAIKNNREARRDMSNKQDEDVIRAYSNESGLNEDQMRVLFSYAYNESHSAGIHEVLMTLDDVVDLVKEVNDKK